MTIRYDDAVAHLRGCLERPLPGSAAQLRMAPAHRQEPALAGVPETSCREAAVLIPLFPLEGEAAVVLTVRRDDLRHHGGQISFPGGRREPDEALRRTALREAEEEIGLRPDEVDVLGTLTPLYVPPSNFCVYPYVGAVPYVPDLLPHDREVAAILHVPIGHLLDPKTLLREPWVLRGQEVEVPYFSVDAYKIWGATAMILGELLTLFE